MMTTRTPQSATKPEDPPQWRSVEHMPALTYRERLGDLRRELLELYRAFKGDGGAGAMMLEIAAGAVGDALKEMPRLVLARRLPDAAPALDERKPPAPAGTFDGDTPSKPTVPAPLIAGQRPCKKCGQLGHDGRRHRYEASEAAAAPPARAEDEHAPEEPDPPARVSAAAIVDHRDRIAAWATGPHALRHYLAAPDAGEGLARCGALGESVRVVGKLSMVTCPECRRLMGSRCRRCDQLGHVMRQCPLKGDTGVATLRAFRAEAAAKLEAVAAQPLEIVVTANVEEIPPKDPCAETINAPQLNLTSMPTQAGAWDRSDPDEDLTDLDFGATEEPSATEARESFPAHLVAELPRSLRAVWEAVGRDGRAVEEVSKERGRSLSTVKQQFITARGRLRRLAQELPTLVTPPPPISLTADPTPAQERIRSKLRVIDGRVRSTTIAARRLSRDEKADGADLLDPSAYDRPLSRGDCEPGGINEARPCPHVACPHHLALDVNDESGSFKLNFPHLEVWEMTETCSLDVADRGGITLEEVGAILNLSRERIRQVEVRGLAKIKDSSGDELGLPPDRGSNY